MLSGSLAIAFSSFALGTPTPMAKRLIPASLTACDSVTILGPVFENPSVSNIPICKDNHVGFVKKI